MIKKPIVFIPLGKPGSGKGTLTKMLVSHFREKIFTSDTGELIRSSLKSVPGAVILNDYHKGLFQKTQDSGRLQTSATAILHWSQHLRSGYTGEPYMAIDGSPRRKYELFALYEDLTETYNADVRFIEIKVTDEVAIEHMEIRNKISPRPETANIEVIKRRIAEYKDKVAPTIQIIRSVFQGVYIKDIDNNGSLSELEKKLQHLLLKEEVLV